MYSTDQGRHCPGCGRPKHQCTCKKTNAIQPGDGIIRLQRQSKGRAGKPVVVITGLSLQPAELKKLAKKIKAKCGVGGSIDANNILIQGDKRDVIKIELETLGYTVKIAGA